MTVSLQGKRVALIGGAGFIGHHLALGLKRMGAHVEIVDSLQINNFLAFTSAGSQYKNREWYLQMINQRLDLLRQADIALHVQDARDYSSLTRILVQINPQVVVHLAAIAHAGLANKDPYSTFDHSLRTLENALDATRNNFEHFVFFSSSMAYGNFLKDEVDEEHPLNPIGIYGALKMAGEKIVQAYQQVFNLPCTIVRPSALYGPRCVSRRVTQIFIESALKGETLRVEGDGKERLDFTYIDDLVQGISLVIARPEARNQTFNLTYGGSRSILDLVSIMRGHFPEIKVEHATRDKLMPVRGTLSVEKARNRLGYAPAYPLEKGIADYVRWYREFKTGG